MLSVENIANRKVMNMFLNIHVTFQVGWLLYGSNKVGEDVGMSQIFIYFYCAPLGTGKCQGYIYIHGLSVR